MRCAQRSARRWKNWLLLLSKKQNSDRIHLPEFLLSILLIQKELRRTDEPGVVAEVGAVNAQTFPEARHDHFGHTRAQRLEKQFFLFGNAAADDQHSVIEDMHKAGKTCGYIINPTIQHAQHGFVTGVSACEDGASVKAALSGRFLCQTDERRCGGVLLKASPLAAGAGDTVLIERKMADLPGEATPAGKDLPYPQRSRGG